MIIDARNSVELIVDIHKVLFGHVRKHKVPVGQFKATFLIRQYDWIIKPWTARCIRNMSPKDVSWVCVTCNLCVKMNRLRIRLASKLSWKIARLISLSLISGKQNWFQYVEKTEFDIIIYSEKFLPGIRE